MSANESGRGGFSRWLVRGLSRLLVLVLAFVAGAIVMHVGMHGGDREHMQALQAQNAELQAKLTQSQADLGAQHSQTSVQDGTQRALQDKIAGAEARIAEIKAKALADVGTIAEDTTGALVEQLIGAKATKAEVASAVKTAAGE